jgi:feruloyl esterase
MNHSRGGPATDQVNMLDALVEWVERGQPPAPSSPAPAAPVRPCPIPRCQPTGAGAHAPTVPMPQVARYNGSGSPQDASSFSCR